MANPVSIEILYFDGCPNVEAAREMVSDVIDQAGADAQIVMIKVETDADAQEQHFIGSPSIRVEGKDVDTAGDNNQQYSMRCRVYFADQGVSGLPPRAKLLGAIEQALKSAGYN